MSAYSSIVPDAGKTAPSGVAIYGFSNANGVSTETGVPATAPVSAGRIYAEIAPPLNTGIAITNPNSTPATITFSFTSATGASAGSGTKTLAAHESIAQFLDQAPFKVYPGSTFQGTLSFTSTLPVGVMALRGFNNERGDFLMSTLPFVDTTAMPKSGTVVVPHFADGGGSITQIFLVNPTDNALSGSVQFRGEDGTIGGQTNSSFPYSIPGRSAQKLATAGTGTNTAQGSVAVVPAAGGIVPTALVLFSYKPTGVIVAEAGVPLTSGTAFRLYVESAGTPFQPGSIQSGIAVANTSPSSVPVTFDITDLNGSPVAGISPHSETLLPSGHIGKFLGQFFPSLPNSFKGVLRVTSDPNGPPISVTGLRTRYNQRQPVPDFLYTTTPVSIEGDAPATGQLLLPTFVNGGGYTTQFILFSGSQGQSSTGNLRFYDLNGSALNVNLN
ncbi:MAG: hypothetical protein E6J54_28685 [Deltaproteobacteria bacterium]|nr:MAG: hypothetical protein E6J54_28685 [Deltaproteobacteria bacterium]